MKLKHKAPHQILIHFKCVTLEVNKNTNKIKNKKIF